MKLNRQSHEIAREDLESLFFWKVFRKIIRQESLFLFLMKVTLISFAFAILIFALLLLASRAGN